jgi:uncharacterized protein
VIHVRYLHGFASGPGTSKGQALGRRLAGAVASYAIPDLEAGDFTGLTMERMRERAVASLPGAPTILVGSSLGGYLAAMIASTPGVVGAVLIAPAFHFPGRWDQRLGADAVARWRDTGSHPFFHHGQGRELPLGSAFLASCESLPGLPAQARTAAGAPMPMAIVHGREDDVVDYRGSVEFHASRQGVELHVVAGDHRLGEPRHEDLIAWCVGDLLRRFG